MWNMKIISRPWVKIRLILFWTFSFMFCPHLGIGARTTVGVEHASRVNNERLIQLESSTSQNEDEDEPETPCLGCGRSGLNEEIVKARRIAEVKRDILAQLGELPGSDYDTIVPKLPQNILDLSVVHNATEQSFDPHEKELIIAGKELSDKCVPGRQAVGCYQFNIESEIEREVASAKLWVYKTPDANDIQGQTLRVFQLEKTTSGDLQRGDLLVGLDTSVHEGWVKLDITKPVKSWLDKERSTITLAITCDTSKTHSHTTLFGAKKGYQPLLIIDYDISKIPRREREERSNSNCNPSFSCCRRPLVLSFAELGIEHVIAPRTVPIGYCFGNCNHEARYLGTHNHTGLMMLVKERDPTVSQAVKNQLRVCCVPKEVRDTVLLHYGGPPTHGLRLTYVARVIVSSCGCA